MENNNKNLGVFGFFCEETERILKQSQDKVKAMFARVYEKQGLYGEVCNKEEIYEQLVQYAKRIKMKTVYIRNTSLLVRSIGCYYCTIEVLKRLEEIGISTIFVEENLCTGNNKHDDMLIGAKLAEKSIEFQHELFSSMEDK